MLSYNEMLLVFKLKFKMKLIVNVILQKLVVNIYQKITCSQKK